jgi:hypothetical protein
MNKLKNLDKQKLIYAGILVLPVPLYILFGSLMNFILFKMIKLSLRDSVPYIMITPLFLGIMLITIGFCLARLLKASVVKVLIVNFILGSEMFLYTLILLIQKYGINKIFVESSGAKIFDWFFFSTLYQVIPVLIGWGIGLYINSRPKLSSKSKKKKNISGA